MERKDDGELEGLRIIFPLGPSIPTGLILFSGPSRKLARNRSEPKKADSEVST
jgi:hypothetical protein